MKKPLFMMNIFIAAIMLFSAAAANAQVVEKVKDTAEKAKDVTVDTTKKTKVVVVDSLEKAEDKAGDAKDTTVDATKKAASSAKTFGSHTVSVSENVTEAVIKEGRYYTVSTWDGTKWVAKKVWYPTKKTSGKIKETATGDNSPDQ